MPEMCFQCERNGRCLLISIARKLFAECINIEKWVAEPVEPPPDPEYAGRPFADTLLRESPPPDVDVCPPCSKRLTPFHPCPDPGCKTNLKKLESPPPCHTTDCEWCVEGRCRGNFEACNQFKEDDCPRVHRLEKALHEIRRLEILDCYEKCDNYPETDDECTDEECPKYPIIKLTEEASEQ
jgi:hypothetical protein